MSAISPATDNNNILSNPVGQADETKNVALGNVKEGADGSKGIWNKVKSFAAKTGEAVKNFLFATADFLKNSGVRLGTTLGIAVGVLAVVGCIKTSRKPKVRQMLSKKRLMTSNPTS